MLVAGITLALLLVWPRLNLKLPGPFIALVVATGVVYHFHLPVETIAGRFGPIDLTVLVDLAVAVEVGMVLAAFLFMRRMAEVSNVSAVMRKFEEGGDDGDGDPNGLFRREVPAGDEVYEINGPFFFGAAEKFKETMTELRRPPRVLVIHAHPMAAIQRSALATRSRRRIWSAISTTPSTPPGRISAWPCSPRRRSPFPPSRARIGAATLARRADPT